VHVSTADDAPLLWRGDRGGIGRLLAGLGEPDIVELWEWRLTPGERHLSAGHAAGTREVLHVLTGELIVTVNGADYAVGAGQTIEFCADRTHGYRNDGTEPIRLMMVVVIPRP
jgi:quercetin dioxygenase-like cupin family protein